MEIKKIKKGQVLCNIQKNTLISFNTVPNKIFKVVENDEYKDNCIDCDIRNLGCCNYVACMASHCHFKLYKNIDNSKENKEMKDSDKEYKNGKFECLTTMEGIKGWYYAAIFCSSNIFKYSWRLGKKDAVLKENAKITDYSNRYKDILERNMKYEYSGKKVAIIDIIDNYVIYFDGKDKHIINKSVFDKFSKLIN